LATKDHFSSNWTSRVPGGKSHEVVVELAGVVAGHEGEPDNSVLVDPGQAAGLADADALLQVSQDGEEFIAGQAAVKQGRALALAEAILAGAAGQAAAFLGGAVAEGDAEVAVAAPAVVGAARVLAAAVLEFVHRAAHRNQEQRVARMLPLL